MRKPIDGGGGGGGGGGCECTGNVCCDGCWYVDAGMLCVDGQYCTTLDRCNGTGACVGTPRDCSAAGGLCTIGACNEALDQCVAVPDPAGDSNACTANDTCNPATGVWTPGAGVCDEPDPFTATVTGAGVALAWSVPAGATRVDIFRTPPGVVISHPGPHPDRIYSGTATSFLDVTAPGGVALTYAAFAVFAAGWTEPLVRTLRVDDRDFDGMPDGWEATYGLNPLDPGDAIADGDNDGLSNLGEFAQGTNPTVTDSDADGLDDGHELSIGTDPSRADTDGDGMADGFELQTGLDPLNGYDFAMGLFAVSSGHVLGAYTFDAGEYAFDPVTRQSVIGSGDRRLVIASSAQPSAIGSTGGQNRFAYSGYLYTVEEMITPNHPPICDAGLDQTVTLPGTVQLTGAASDPNGDAITVAWRFVDVPTGSVHAGHPFATIVNRDSLTPSFTPDRFGYYMLELSLTDVAGAVSPPCYVVVTAIDNQLFYQTGPFTALSPSYKLVGHTQSVAGGLPLGLTSSPSGVVSGQVVGDRGPGGAATSSGNHLDAGFLSVALADSLAVGSGVVNQAPVAEAGPDQTIAFSDVVRLDGGDSRDPDAYPGPLTYQWTLWSKPTGSAAVLTSATSQVAFLTPDVAGAYVVILRVSDGNLAGVPDPVVVTVANRAPVAVANVVVSPQVQGQGDEFVADYYATVVLDGAASHDPEGAPLTYYWSFFRKPEGSVAALSNPGAVGPSFTPDLPGNYWVKLVVKDGLRPSAPDFVIVHHTELDGNFVPTAVLGPDQFLTGTTQTGVDASESSDPDWDPVAVPDPDGSGIYRKGLSYVWSIASAPPPPPGFPGPDIRCAAPAPTPAFDCPRPTLFFNGVEGTYEVALQVVDVDGGVSDRVTTLVHASAIPNVTPVAVASPRNKQVIWSIPAEHTVVLDGSGSDDPVTHEVLSYQWTLVERPASSSAALINATTVSPTLPMDVGGQYRVHLRVCDSTGRCSCAFDEQTPGDPDCNAQSIAQVGTASDLARVAMPTGWPAAGAPGGSGGAMTLFLGDDGVYDKPLVMAQGLNLNFEAAQAGGGLDFGALAGVVADLRAHGYDVWWVSFDSICDGDSVIQPVADASSCGEEYAQTHTCKCPFPERPVDNHMSLNAVVLAHAVAQAKAYGPCAGLSADAATGACFVRVYGQSMGGVIARVALAWAESSDVTVPFAAGESAPYALNGLRAKPAGITSWDLGARVFISGDGPQQGANVPPSFIGLFLAYEAAVPDPAASGGPLSKLGMRLEGAGTIIAWVLLKWRSGAKYLLKYAGQLKDHMGTQTGDKSKWEIASDLYDIYVKVRKWMNSGLKNNWVGQAFMGFVEGFVAGWGTAVVGAAIKGGYAALKYELYTYLATLGPWGWVAIVVIEVLDYFFDFGSALFHVEADFDMKVVDDQSSLELSPVHVTSVVSAPAVRELLYETITDYDTCDQLPLLLQGDSKGNIYPAGFGKYNHGEWCNGSMDITTSSAEHDAFYAWARNLNGNGYARHVRSVGVSLGSTTTEIPAGNTTAFDLYLPYTISNQRYRLGAHDHQPGSVIGGDILADLGKFQIWLRGEIEITRHILWEEDTKTEVLFDDRVYVPSEPLAAGLRFPFIPTVSSTDFRPTGACAAGLSCCQLLPPGTEPSLGGTSPNCCACTTGFDGLIRPRFTLAHAPTLAVNPCRRGENPEMPWFEHLRDGCVATFQGEQAGQGQVCAGDGDNTWYVDQTPSGFLCFPIFDDSVTAETLRVTQLAIQQLDLRHRCEDIAARFVCHDGTQTCAPANGSWLWVGGSDRDGDGCPGQTLSDGTLCANTCETDAQDQDSTVTPNAPTSNQPPTIAVVGSQLFGLPTCSANAEQRTYACRADAKADHTPLTVWAAGTDLDGDPMTYHWTFVPDPAQGQAASDVVFSNTASATPAVGVAVDQRPPQGSYRLRAVVYDNKGGRAEAETTVVVPGDAPPAVLATAPSSVNEVCELVPNLVTNEASRCYADLELNGSVVDPDGPDSTSILLQWWEDVTDREASGYAGITLAHSPNELNAGIQVYASEGDAATPVGSPLVFRLHAIDVRGQESVSDVAIAVCLPDGGGCNP